MFKDFSSFNSKQSKVLQPKSVLALSDAIRVQSALLSSLQSVVSRYTRAYNSVQVIKYDENGDPIDVTPSEQLTVPENILKFTQAQIDQVRTQLDEYRDVVSDLTSTITITPQMWQRNLDSNIVCLAGHAIHVSDLVGGRDIPEVKLMVGARVSNGQLILQATSTYIFSSTAPDVAALNGIDGMYGWINGSVGFAYSDASIATVGSEDIYAAFFCNGSLFGYSMTGKYLGKVDNFYSGSLSNQLLVEKTLGSYDNIYTQLSLCLPKSSVQISGPVVNLSTTDVQPTVAEDYIIDSPAILLDSIITPDQNLVDIKDTL